MHQMKESGELPGFYEIPGFSNYIINLEGIIYNRHRKTYSKNVNPKGSTTLIDDLGKKRTVSKTRALALAKHGKPHNDNSIVFEKLPYSKTTRNNDKQWTISSNRPIKAKCLITGSEWEYDDLYSFCIDFGLPFTSVRQALSRSNPSLFRGYIQTYQENKSNMDKLVPYGKNKNIGNGYRKIVCINDAVGSVTIYPDLKSVSIYEGLTISTIKYYLKFKGSKAINFCRFIYYDDLPIEFTYKNGEK